MHSQSIKNLDIYFYIGIAILGAILFVPFLGHVHLFDWDEINFAESAREMIVSNNYARVQINFSPFWEKPPLFFWMQALSMQAFGINEFAARFPNAICGIITLLLLFYIGKKNYSRWFGIFWALAYAGSFLPHFYFKSGIIDPWFNLFIFLSIFQWSNYIKYKYKQKKLLVYAALFAGLGILTKGPVALLIILSTVAIYYVLYHIRDYKKAIYNFIIFGLITMGVSLLWFGLEVIHNGFAFINEFIEYQIRLLYTHDAGHGGFFLYHFVILYIGCFPAIIFLFIGWNMKKNDVQPMTLHRMMQIALWVILIVFTLVQTKIIHYSSFAYFPITYFAAMGMYRLFIEQKKISLIARITWLFLGILWGLVLLLLPILMMYKNTWMHYIRDVFALGNLQAHVSWSPWDMIWGIAYLGIVIIAYIWICQKKYLQSFFCLIGGTILLIQIVVYCFVGRVEQYSQGAAIEFLETLKNKDCYVEALRMRSYAIYFYPEVRPHTNPEYKNIEWLLHGNIDKPAYFISRNNFKESIITENPNLKLLYEKNGYCFWERKLK